MGVGSRGAYSDGVTLHGPSKTIVVEPLQEPVRQPDEEPVGEPEAERVGQPDDERVAQLAEAALGATRRETPRP